MAMSTSALLQLPSSSSGEVRFPLVHLPILVLEKVISFVSDPFDIKALRRTCKLLKSVVDKNPEALVHLKIAPVDLNGLSYLVQHENTMVQWNNIRFPPELYHVGCRRHYAETFNGLLSSFSELYGGRIRILELNHLNLSNVNYVNLIKSCQKLEALRVDTMIIKGVEEKVLKEILEDEVFSKVLENLSHLDVTAFEFLNKEFQFKFMGQFLAKCKNLKTLGSWGYFPEWEQPIGGVTHFKYFLWPLITYLRSRFEIVDLMLQASSVQSPKDLSNLNLEYLNDSMDWQSAKWVLDLMKEVQSDCTTLERFLYSRITSYVHRAVGWFDEDDYRKSGLSLMTNLQTIHIHNTRDVKLTGENPYGGGGTTLFPKLKNLSLVVGNRKPPSSDNNNQNQQDDLEPQVLLEKVIVTMLLNTSRPSVKHLNLDIDLNHHHQYGSLDLPSVITNFPNVTTFCVEEWGPTDEQILTVFQSFPLLESLMFCGRNLSDLGILGSLDEDLLAREDLKLGIRKLTRLQILKIFSVRLPPKNVFPWPTKENNRITDLSFRHGFGRLPLRKFHFLLKSDSITRSSIEFLRSGPISKSVSEFVINWLPEGISSTDEFHAFHESFKFMDPQTFLEPANFIIPDIGEWESDFDY